MRQLGLTFSSTRKASARGTSVRGGARTGAGKKPRPASERHTPHRARAQHQARHPLHVTLRASFRSLRKQQLVQTILGALRDSRREGFRIVHYSVQHNHLHLIVEADSKTVLSSAMRGLAIRVTLRVNRLLFRHGRLWADRWHSHTLKTPREVRNALRYVLQNHKKHGSFPAALDPLSSAQWFNGFAQSVPSSFQSIGPPCIAPPKTWLLNVGWRCHGLIEI